MKHWAKMSQQLMHQILHVKFENFDSSHFFGYYWQTANRFPLFLKANYRFFTIGENCHKRIMLFRNLKIRYRFI